MPPSPPSINGVIPLWALEDARQCLVRVAQQYPHVYEYAKQQGTALPKSE